MSAFVGDIPLPLTIILEFLAVVAVFPTLDLFTAALLATLLAATDAALGALISFDLKVRPLQWAPLSLQAIDPCRLLALNRLPMQSLYGPDLRQNSRRGADYVDKVLRGASPADLPVEQPTKFEFVINLKTAKELGLAPPPTLLGLADEVFE